MQESDEIQHTCSSRYPSPDFSLLVSTTDVAGLLGPEAQPLPGLQLGLPASSETTALLRSSFPMRAHTHTRHLTPHSFLPNFPPAREAQGAGCAQRCRRCGEACHLPPGELPTGPEELHPWNRLEPTTASREPRGHPALGPGDTEVWQVGPCCLSRPVRPRPGPAGCGGGGDVQWGYTERKGGEARGRRE